MELPLWGLKIVTVIGRQLSLLRFLLFDFSLLLLSLNQKKLSTPPLPPPRLVPEGANQAIQEGEIQRCTLNLDVNLPGNGDEPV